MYKLHELKDQLKNKENFICDIIALLEYDLHFISVKKCRIYTGFYEYFENKIKLLFFSVSIRGVLQIILFHSYVNMNFF